MNKSEYLHIQKAHNELLAKFKSLLEEGLPWYEKQALNLFELRRFDKRQDDQLIQQILGKSPNDENRKKQSSDYYISNAIVFLKVMRRILHTDFLRNFEKSGQDDLIVYNYHRLFRHLLFDSLVLLNEFAGTIKRIDPVYGCGKSPIQHTMTLYHSLGQSLYGQASFHSRIETEPDLSTSIIRQLIELRIRRAFGVIAWYDPNTDSVEPLPVSRIFDILKQFSRDIKFSIPLENISRIYGWSNIFLHVGIKDYLWKHIFVTDYLKTFALGKRGSWNTYSAISVSRSVLDHIAKELESKHPKGAQVIRCNPEATILDA